MNSHNPIFGKRFLQNKIGEGNLPKNWQELIKSIEDWKAKLEKGDIQDEKTWQDDFVKLIFHNILGYKIYSIEGYPCNCDREYKPENSRDKVDAVLGFIEKKSEGKIYLAIELKAPGKEPGKNLEKKDASQLTAVEQCFGYTGKLGKTCSFFIVSDMWEIRLYSRNSTNEYESFNIYTLATEAEFRKFYYLLNPMMALPGSQSAETGLEKLYKENEKDQEQIGAKFYKHYRDVRESLFQQIEKSNPGKDKHILLDKTQKLLDKYIFLCFCEDMGFIGKYEGRYLTDFALSVKSLSGTVIWNELKALYSYIDGGSDGKRFPVIIPRYNGELFKPDEELDSLIVPNEAFNGLKELAKYDFLYDLDVNILGKIFESSISDLEEMKALFESAEFDKKKGKRKRQGIYYTPPYITGYIIEKTVGRWITTVSNEIGIPDITPEDYEALDGKTKLGKDSKDRIRERLEALKKLQEKVLNIRICDPACGSGAFLNKAFLYLQSWHKSIWNERKNLGDPECQTTEIEHDILGGKNFDEWIVSNNLYGVDIEKTSVELTKLSLWLRLVHYKKPLPLLEKNIKNGDSIVGDDPKSEHPFVWQEQFEHVFAQGGFDVVIGNPPYVRQELLAPIKPMLASHYPDFYNGVADLYAYFFRKGFQILKPGGYLGFISSSTFTKTSSGENLRKYLRDSTSILEFIDFGDLDVWNSEATNYPCIFIAQNTSPDGQAVDFREVVELPPDKSETMALVANSKSYEVVQGRLGGDSWNFDKPEVEALRNKIFGKGKPLKDVVNGQLFRGILTGLDEAFIIDKATKDRLIKEDPKSAEIIKPFLLGRDLDQWHYDIQNRYLIYIPWHFPLHEDPTIQGPSRKAEELFKQLYPAVYNHLFIYKNKLLNRNKAETEIRYEWYALQRFASDYNKSFVNSKIIYAKMHRTPKFSLDFNEFYFSTSVYMILTSDFSFLSILMSRCIWFYIQSVCAAMRGGMWRYILHVQYVETFPIVEPPGSEDDPSTTKGKLSTLARLCQDSAFERHALRKKFIEIITDDLKEYIIKPEITSYCEDDIGEVSERSALNCWDKLDWPSFRSYAKSSSGFGKPFEMFTSDWRKEDRLKTIFNELKPEIGALTAKIHAAEREINQIVYGLYDLTPDEIRLLEEQTGNIYED